jgi:predicted Zn-dependent protease
MKLPEWSKGVTLAVCAATVVACAANPVTGRRQLMLVSESSAISSSAQAYTQMMAPLEQEGRINRDKALQNRINLMTGKLVAQAIRYRPETKDWKWEVKIIDDPKTVNAFCMAGGKMAVYTGLIEQIKPTDDELAQVMGHEIAHALSSHTVEKMSIALATNIAVTAIAVTSDRPGVALTGAALAAALAIQLPNSRTAETEADRIGIELAARAGYNPYAAVTLWEKMGKASGAGESKFDWLSTHPAPARRQETLAELAPKMMPYYESREKRPVFPLKSN